METTDVEARPDGYDRSPKQIRVRADAGTRVLRKYFPWGSPRELLATRRVTQRACQNFSRSARPRERRAPRSARRTTRASARSPGRSTGGDEPPPPPDLSRAAALVGGAR